MLALNEAKSAKRTKVCVCVWGGSLLKDSEAALAAVARDETQTPSHLLFIGA